MANKFSSPVHPLVRFWFANECKRLPEEVKAWYRGEYAAHDYILACYQGWNEEDIRKERGGELFLAMRGLVEEYEVKRNAG